MTTARGTTLALAAGLVLLSVGLASAQVPIRVRGSIAKVSGQTLTIASRDNSTVDIKAGTFVASRGWPSRTAPSARRRC